MLPISFIKGSSAKFVRGVSDTGGVGVVDRGGVVLPVSEPFPENGKNPTGKPHPHSSPPTAAQGHAPRPLHAVGDGGVTCDVPRASP